MIVDIFERETDREREKLIPEVGWTDKVEPAQMNIKNEEQIKAISMVALFRILLQSSKFCRLYKNVYKK